MGTNLRYTSKKIHLNEEMSLTIMPKTVSSPKTKETQTRHSLVEDPTQVKIRLIFSI